MNWRAFFRWCAVLPAAMVAYLLSSLPVLVVTLGTSDWWAQFLQSVVNPAAAIWAGAKVAPKAERTVAALLAVTQAVALTGLALYSLTTGHQWFDEPLWWMIICWGAGVWGSIVGYLLIRAKRGDKASF